MIEFHELALAIDDPEFVELTDQIAGRLQTGEEIDVHGYVRRYPRWADAICSLLPTMQNLVDYGRAVNRDRRRGQKEQVKPNNTDNHKP